jgi:hypothetical protein
VAPGVAENAFRGLSFLWAINFVSCQYEKCLVRRKSIKYRKKKIEGKNQYKSIY